MAAVYDRRMIGIDPKTQTYSVVTFDQIRAAIHEAQARAEQRGAPANAHVTLTPGYGQLKNHCF